MRRWRHEHQKFKGLARLVLTVAVMAAVCFGSIAPADAGRRSGNPPQHHGVITGKRYARYCSLKPLAPQPRRSRTAVAVKGFIKCRRNVVESKSFYFVYRMSSGKTIVKDDGFGAWGTVKRGVETSVIDDVDSCDQIFAGDEGDRPRTMAIRIALRSNPKHLPVTLWWLHHAPVLKTKTGPSVRIARLCRAGSR
jgi:hypothetical protein